MKQHALITGAGTGIGRALCERLLKKNHEVIGVGRRPAPLEKLKQDFDVVKVDYKFLNRETGLKNIRLKKEIQPTTESKPIENIIAI